MTDRPLPPGMTFGDVFAATVDHIAEVQAAQAAGDIPQALFLEPTPKTSQEEH